MVLCDAISGSQKIATAPAFKPVTLGMPQKGVSSVKTGFNLQQDSIAFMGLLTVSGPSTKIFAFRVIRCTKPRCGK